MITLKHNETYTYDKKKGFDVFDPLDYKYKGYTITSLYKLNKDKEHKLNTINELSNKLSFIKGKDIIEKLNNLLSNEYMIIKQGERYNGVKTDQDGYVLTHNECNVALKDAQIPLDVDSGVWKVKEGKLEKDKEREMILWSL